MHHELITIWNTAEVANPANGAEHEDQRGILLDLLDLVRGGKRSTSIPGISSPRLSEHKSADQSVT